MCKRKFLPKLLSDKWLLLLGVIGLMHYGNLGAETATLVPDGDLTTGWDHSTGTSHYTEIDEGIGSADDDATKIYTRAVKTARIDKFNLTTASDILECTEITVKVRIKTTSSFGQVEVDVKLLKANDTQIGNTWTISDATDSWANKENTWSGLSFSQSDIDGIRVELTKCGDFTYTNAHVSVLNVVIIYSVPMPPNAPSNCSATDDRCDDIVITWTDNSDNEEGFKIYCADSGEIGSVSANDTDYTHTPLPGTYEYYVTAYDVIGESESNHDDGTRLATIITVTFPNGGEAWCQELPYDITWTSACISGNVNIELYKGDSLNSTIASDAPDSGLYIWTIPATQTLGTDYKVRVTSVTDSSIWDESDNEFTIRSPYILVTQPNVGEFWVTGTSYDITWMTEGVGGNVNIELYKGGSFDSVIANDVPNNESYNWSIPTTQTLGTDYKVRITSVTDSSIWDESDSDFSITELITVTLISPDGGESWTGRSSHEIRWSSTGAGFDSYRLLYSLTPDSGWITVVHSISSPHPYSERYDNTWIISYPGAKRIKVHFSKLDTEEDFDFVYLYDKNDNKIATYSGNLGTFWSAEVPGDIVKVRFKSDDDGNYYGFDIDKYEALHDYDTIAINISPDSSLWNWIVPNATSATCKVKVQMLNDSNDIIAEDKSDNYFSITGVSIEEKTGRRQKAEGISVSVFPNPATRASGIRFQIPDFRYQKPDIRHPTSNILLKIYDLSGRLVRSLSIHDSRFTTHEIMWDGRDNESKKVRAGIYFYHFKYRDSEDRGKFVILK